MPITKHEFKKYSDPDFSLLDQEFRILNTKLIVFLIFISIILFPFGIMFIALNILAKRSYDYVKMLQERGRVDKLLEKSKLHIAEYHTRFSIYALVDMKVKDIAFLLNDKQEEGIFIFTNFDKKIQKALEVLAAKLDFNSVEKMLSSLEKPTQRYRIVPSIPITSVYYLEDEPLKAKCMISSLLLDFDEDIVVACPNCGNLAKKELLTEWLEENGSCKSCDRIISMADCPLVKIRK